MVATVEVILLEGDVTRKGELGDTVAMQVRMVDYTRIKAKKWREINHTYLVRKDDEHEQAS